MGVIVNDGVDTGVNFAVGVEAAINVWVAEGEGAGKVGVEVLTAVGTTWLKWTRRGATHNARSPADEPRDDTYKINLIFCPAKELRSRSRLKYLPS